MTEHQSLDDAIDRRRLELGLTWREVAEEAGITPETLRAIRRGANEPSRLTQRGIEQALRWPPGTISSIRAGRPLDDDRTRSVTELLDESEAMLAELHERLDRLPPRRIGTVLRLVRDLDEEDPPESSAR